VRNFASTGAAPALTIAVLFLGPQIWLNRGPDSGLIGICALSLICAALYYVGPALRPPSGLFALAFRFLAAIYLVTWMAGWLSVIAPWIDPRDSSVITTGLIRGAILLFLWLTPNASMSLPLKLNIAIFIAAAIRVRSGWRGAPAAMMYPPAAADLVSLSLLVAPLAVIAAWMSPPSPRVKTSLLTFALPFACVLAAIAALNGALFSSELYRPSIYPSLAMALTSGTAHAGKNAIFLVFAVSMLGALRFGMSAMKRATGDRWFLLGCLISATTWLAAHPFREDVHILGARISELLAACAAILTADAVLRSRDSESDWPRLVSLLLAISILTFAHLWRVEEYPQAWMLPSYGLAFAMQMTLRLLVGRRQALP
jgi:hypothetical protein